MPALRLGHQERLCRDPQALAEFYLRLGFTLTAWQGEDFCWLALGEFELLLRKSAAESPAESWGAQRQGLVLYTKDLDRTLAVLEAAGIPVASHDGDENCPLVRDPEGCWIQLVQHGEN